MHHIVRIGAGLGILVAGCTLAACASTPARPDNLEARGGPTTTSTTTTTLPDVTVPTTASSTTLAGVVVPNVIGMKPNQARLVLRSLGFVLVPFNTPCLKDTSTSQSVVSSLSVPGPGTDARVGAAPIAPGAVRPARSPIGVTWSGCYPNGTVVPDVTGLTFDTAVHRLHLAGLAWACFSVPPTHAQRPTTTSSTSPGTPPTDSATEASAPGDRSTDTSAPADVTKKKTTTTTHHGTSTKHHDTSTTTTAPSQTPHAPAVLSQGIKPGTALRAHTVVDITMHHCPQ
jgi:hypothetical protein